MKNNLLLTNSKKYASPICIDVLAFRLYEKLVFARLRALDKEIFDE